MADDEGRQLPSRRAAEELAQAKADARQRGQRPAGQAGGVPRPRAPRPGRRGRRDDPQPLSAAIDGLLGDHGWRTAAAAGSVFGRWDHIAGREVAAHTRPARFSDGEVVVVADSTAWATQVRLLAPALVRRLNEELGDGAVRRVTVRGPSAPWQPGPWRIRGARPHDGDYG